ncbi:hypothetical protein CSKR_201589 [Clonorchis sinensis]|uniref:Uncharacterized protein n=1 Tax=Clonorchis sinensis TaxID=79923 RepID=A0A8T1MTJ6_CLOSI|nr:hypothetical protein CSKR_201589 [Clonorchis sinensis]
MYPWILKALPDFNAMSVVCIFRLTLKGSTGLLAMNSADVAIFKVSGLKRTGLGCKPSRFTALPAIALTYVEFIHQEECEGF